MKIRRLGILLLLLSINLVSGQKKYQPTPTIPLETLVKRGLIPSQENYKRNYPFIMSYLLYNIGGTFNKIHGDFMNLDYQDSDLNFQVAYFEEYGKYQRSLTVLVSLSATSTLSIENAEIKAHSSTFGDFERERPWGNTNYNRRFERVLLVKPLVFKNRKEIYKLLADDVITVTVGGQEYIFISPEVVLPE